MDKKLQIVQHLYDEAEDPAALRELLRDDACKAEHQAMSEMKFLLDHRPATRPPAASLDRILAAAADPASIPAPGADRPARPRLRLVRSTWMSAAAVIALLMFVGLWYLPNEIQPAQQALLDDATSTPLQTEASRQFAESPADLTADLAAKAEAATEARESEEADAEGFDDAAVGFASALDPKDEAGGAAPQRLAAPATAGLQLASATDSLTPSWDEAEQLIRYQRRIQMLLEQTEGLEWDAPAVPLEMLPGQARTLRPGLHQAGSRARGTGNQ